MRSKGRTKCANGLNKPSSLKDAKTDDVLEGTSKKVFRYIYHQPGPVGVHDIYRGMGLSSPSLAHYHVNKLLKAGMIREEGDGYVVNRVFYDDMMRIGGTVLPLRVAYALFFLTALIALATILRPAQLSSTYVFATVVVGVAAAVTMLEARKASKAL